jgi:hypothetical protein
LIPHRFLPVEEYLRPQRRFRHLFFPERQEETLSQIQYNIDTYWAAARNESRDSQSNHPDANQDVSQS